jgi:hypothetical protein
MIVTAAGLDGRHLACFKTFKKLSPTREHPFFPRAHASG